MISARPIVSGIACAAVLAGAALALKYAAARHAISADQATHGYQVLLGLVLAIYGNAIPKNLPRFRGDDAFAGRRQALLLAGGWLFTLAGLAYAGLWLFAPAGIASDVGMALVGAATALVAGYSLWGCVAGRSDRHRNTVS